MKLFSKVTEVIVATSMIIITLAMITMVGISAYRLDAQQPLTIDTSASLDGVAYDDTESTEHEGIKCECDTIVGEYFCIDLKEVNRIIRREHDKGITNFTTTKYISKVYPNPYYIVLTRK